MTPFEQKFSDPTLPCFSLGAHQEPAQLFGRLDVLDEIDGVLLPVTKSRDPGEADLLRSYAICGLGGMGKTEIAVKYAYSRRKHFDAIFWISADNPEVLASDFAKIAQLLGIEDPDAAKDVAASSALVNGWLSQPLRRNVDGDVPTNEASWLMIYDNVDNLDVLSEHWPKTGHGSVLVTSRDPLAKQNLYTEHGMDLKPLAPHDSENMILQLTQRRRTTSQDAALKAIVDRLGGLPLAIVQMSAVIRNRRMPFDEFLTFYEAQGIGRLQRMAPERFSTSDRARSLATCWALDSLSSPTKALLEVLAFLDPDMIPEEILKDHCEAATLKDYPEDAGIYITSRADLAQSSLIEHHESMKQISLHRLVQDTARATIEPDRIPRVLQCAFDLLLSVWPFQDMKEHHSVARFEFCERLFPCVSRLKSHLADLSESGGAMLDIKLARLLNDAGW